MNIKRFSEDFDLSDPQRTKAIELDAINKMIDAIHRSDDLIVILASAIEQIYRSINCDGVNILFHNASAKHFYIHGSLTQQNSVSDNLIIIPYHETSITDIVRSHSILVREDLSQRGQMTPGDVKFLSHDVKSDLSVPIIRKNQLVAILHLSSHQVNFFTKELQFQAELFANLLAFAFDRIDLTEQLNRHKSNLQLWKDKYNSLFENISQPIAMIRNDDDLICSCNPAFQRLTGYSSEQLTGIRLSSLHPEQHDVILTKLDKFPLRAECSDLGVLHLVRNDGQQISTKLSLVPVTNDQRHFVYAIYDPLVLDRSIHRQSSAEHAIESTKNIPLLASFDDLASLFEEPLHLEQLIQSSLRMFSKIVAMDFAQISLFNSDQQIVETHTMISEACRQLSSQQDWMIVEDCEFFWYRVERQNLVPHLNSSLLESPIETKLRSRIATVLSRGNQYLGTLLLGSLNADQYQQAQIEMINRLAKPLAWLIDNARWAPEHEKLKLLQKAKSDLVNLIGQDERIEQQVAALAKLSADWFYAKLTSIHFVEREPSLPANLFSDGRCNSAAFATFERKKIFPMVRANSELYVINNIAIEELADLDRSEVQSIAKYISYLAFALSWKGSPIAILTNYFDQPVHRSMTMTIKVAVLSTIAEDIIRQVKFCQQSAQRLNRLERAIEWAADAIDHFSNDLRAPIASIQALVSAAIAHLDRTDDTELLNLLQKIRVRSRHLQLYIEALAKFADFDLAAPGQQPINSAELLAEVVRHFQPIIQERNIKLHIKKHLPTIRADRQLMFQLFAQLIDSTIGQLADQKNRPTIEISYRSGRGEGFFVIRNNGPVIQNGQLHHLFDSPDLEEDQPNNGIHQRLNLSIAKKIVELHDGQIWYESAAMRGNRFYLRLPTD